MRIFVTLAGTGQFVVPDAEITSRRTRVENRRWSVEPVMVLPPVTTVPSLIESAGAVPLVLSSICTLLTSPDEKISFTKM